MMLYFQATLLVALILGTSLPFTQAGPYGVNIEISVCCKNFVQFPLPLKALTTFRFTSDPCQKRGVILTTKKNREICADPHKAWVKHAIKYIKKKD
ncbi:C-C motif chemokine 22 isoform X2 [Trichosurus vulpecula]|uniref:C-C motif chemokine 22 isoform X2 n=1 Tax=Trichosurus vulpecula TaxID=9337 RepID=UPI00186B2C95|nr:C-C motif chemokine 22 isoform X2 [Trichosurus vulpecula]